MNHLSICVDACMVFISWTWIKTYNGIIVSMNEYKSQLSKRTDSKNTADELSMIINNATKKTQGPTTTRSEYIKKVTSSD